MDVAKQGQSAIAAHLCGMLVAVLASRRDVGNGTSPCAWYLVVFVIDTTLGLFLALRLHHAAVRACAAAAKDPRPKRYGCCTLTQIATAIGKCGSYGDPPRCTVWAWQMTEWTLATVIARAVCGALVLTLSNVLTVLARGVDSLFKGAPRLELASVMVIGPLSLNILQAVLQDQALKRKPGAPGLPRTYSGISSGWSGSVSGPDSPPAGDGEPVAMPGMDAPLLHGGGSPHLASLRSPTNRLRRSSEDLT